MTEDLKASELITLKEAAEYCELSHATLRRLAWSGRLQAKKMGRDWFTTMAAIEKYLISRQRKRKSKTGLDK